MKYTKFIFKKCAKLHKTVLDQTKNFETFLLLCASLVQTIRKLFKVLERNTRSFYFPTQSMGSWGTTKQKQKNLARWFTSEKKELKKKKSHTPLYSHLPKHKVRVKIGQKLATSFFLLPLSLDWTVAQISLKISQHKNAFKK